MFIWKGLTGRNLPAQRRIGSQIWIDRVSYYKQSLEE